MAWPLPQLAPNFEAALRDVGAQRPEARMAAAERLGHASDDERERALEGLLDLTGDGHPDVRATALTALGMLGDARGLEQVLAHLDDAVPAVREYAALAAAQIGGEQALEALRQALRHDTPQVRFQAVAAVAELAPEQAARDVLPLFADPDAEVRGNAVAALASLEQPHLSGHLAGMLEDSAFAVRLEAALGLAAIDDHRGERVLVEALVLRMRVHEVALALGLSNSRSAREPLARLAQSFLAPADVRAAASAALLRLGDERGAAGLRRVLRAFRSGARSYAVELAGQAGALSLVPELLRFIDRPRGVDPLTLVGALAGLASGSPDAKKGLERLAARADEVGQAAREALNQP
jgi:HEAT repeat protein